MHFKCFVTLDLECGVSCALRSRDLTISELVFQPCCDALLQCSLVLLSASTKYP